MLVVGCCWNCFCCVWFFCWWIFVCWYGVRLGLVSYYWVVGWIVSEFGILFCVLVLVCLVCGFRYVDCWGWLVWVFLLVKLWWWVLMRLCCGIWWAFCVLFLVLVRCCVYNYIVICWCDWDFCWWFILWCCVLVWYSVFVSWSDVLCCVLYLFLCWWFGLVVCDSWDNGWVRIVVDFFWLWWDWNVGLWILLVSSWW